MNPFDEFLPEHDAFYASLSTAKSTAIQHLQSRPGVELYLKTSCGTNTLALTGEGKAIFSMLELIGEPTIISSHNLTECLFTLSKICGSPYHAETTQHGKIVVSFSNKGDQAMAIVKFNELVVYDLDECDDDIL